jgi:LmbE family N-acetylglucosaminyl deacetylase
MSSLPYDDVLALSPHTDDAELGAGGTLSKLKRGGADITVFGFSAPRDVNGTEFEASTDVLGADSIEMFDFETRRFLSSRQDILQLLYDYDQEYRPDLVLTPSTNDLHQDHQVVTEEAMRAFKSSTIFGYELPWNNIHFDQNCFVELDDSDLEMKLEMLRKYESQIGRRDYFEEDYLRGLVRTRGVQIGSQFAEGFEVIRMVVNGFEDP